MVLLNYLKQEKKFLIFIFILSLLLNLLFFNFFLKENKDYWRGDTPWYHEVAVQVANGNGIVEKDGVASYYRVPGYSLFLALCYKLLNFNIEKTIYVQILLSTLIPILIFLLSMTLFPGHMLVAKISSFLFTFNLGNWLYSGFVMSEIIFMILFLLFLILFLSSLRPVILSLTEDLVISKKLFLNKEQIEDWIPSQSEDDKGVSKFSKSAGGSKYCELLSSHYKTLFVSGIFLGVASLVRPVGAFVVFLSLFIIVISKLSMQQKFRYTVLFFLSWFLIVSFWLVRNFLLTGDVFFHAMPGDHFVTYLASDVKSIAQDKSFLQARRELLDKWDEFVKKREGVEDKNINYREVSKLGEKISYNIFIKWPFITARRCFLNFLKTIFGFHTSIFLDKYSTNFIGYDTDITIMDKIKLYLAPKVDNKFFIFFIYYEILWMLFYLGAIGFFILSLFRQNLFFVSFVLFLFISLFIFLTLGIGLARLRYPIEPILTILATYFWIKIKKKYFLLASGLKIS